ncbi:ParA family protein [Leptospira santarosai]|uniref:ParA family protein n=1 Tax=Leptospira santarosai TaxID=28183 RepID=UPI0024AEE051|nr:AAA family ATPase [Leptospira santarosai]MDI7166708.1 AAA family ATPase [Leptospira santarosai]MDO6383391.1 AAA family ATPase [Leptospira santarosai]
MKRFALVKRPRVTCFVAHKGGVGKTTDAMGLGQALVALGKSVLLMDFEENNNATDVTLSYHPDYPSLKKRNWYTVLSGAHTIKEAIWKGSPHGFDVLPTVGLIEGAIGMFNSNPGLAVMLSEEIKTLDYDFVIMDLSPLINSITEFALYNSDIILAPVGEDTQGLAGISRVLKFYQTKDPKFNPKLRVLRSNISPAKEKFMLQRIHILKLEATKTVIYKSRAFLNAKNAKEPISIKDKSFNLFIDLANEILRSVE